MDNAHLTRGRPNRLASASCSPDCVFMQCKATLLCYFQKISSILSCHQAVHRLQSHSYKSLHLQLQLDYRVVPKFFFLFSRRRPLGGVHNTAAAAAVMQFQLHPVELLTSLIEWNCRDFCFAIFTYTYYTCSWKCRWCCWLPNYFVVVIFWGIIFTRCRNISAIFFHAGY